MPRMDPLAGFPPGVEPVGQETLVGGHARRAMLSASSRIQSDAVFIYKAGIGQGRLDLNSSIDAANSFSQEEASRIVRQNMAKAMSAPRQLEVTSNILAQDRATLLNLDDQMYTAIDKVEAAKKAKANAAIEFETSSLKLVRKNKAITDEPHSDKPTLTQRIFSTRRKPTFAA